MIATSTILLTLLASADAFYTTKRQAVREFLFDNIPPSRDIEWHPCNETQEVYMECARLSLPLDYQDPDNGLRAIVPIVKYPTNATGNDYKGAVLTNPGGPGYLGTEFVYNPRVAKDLVENITGPGYDILGFDIRGVGYSIPYASCNLTAAEFFDPLRQNATREGNSKRGMQSRGTVPVGALDSETAFGFYVPQPPPSFINTTAQYGDTLNEACGFYTGAQNQAGPHMNTAVTATDMLNIAKALARARRQNETNALVHYYGVSYGTVLGQTFATMYPKNVGKFVLDGVVDMDGWQSRTETGIVRNADRSFFEFFKRCSKAGPKACAFATGSCYQDTIDRFNRMTSRFNATKYEAEQSEIAQAIGTLVASLHGTLLNAMYSAILEWKGLAILLDALDKATTAPIEQWNATEIGEILALPLQEPLQPIRPPAPLQLRSYSFYQCACGDAPSIYNATITPSQQELYLQTSTIGGQARFGDRIICSRYQIRPKWEWHERIGGATKTPILFIGNTLDPVTPWDDAVKASFNFKGSQTILVELMAHATLSQENSCAFRKINAYFQSGKMPGDDYRCPEERKPFT